MSNDNVGAGSEPAPMETPETPAPQPFDVKAFMREKTETRKDIMILDLNGNAIKWPVKGLSGPEMEEVESAVRMNKEAGPALETVAAAISGGAPVKDKLDALKELLGVTTRVPDNYARKLAIFRIGTDSDDVDQAVAVRFGKRYPSQFNKVVNKIWELTSMGAAVKKKPSPSGTDPKSGQGLSSQDQAGE